MKALWFNTIAAAAAFAIAANAAYIRVATAGQAPALKITSPGGDTLVSGLTRLEVAISPPLPFRSC